MRTLKKALSLVLVLAMVFTLAVPALAVDKAADFKDYDKVENKQAVDVLAAIGVINGNTDGTFGPDGKFTRAQAATMLSYLMLGATTADALPVSGTKFSDVPANHWAAKYVQYCAGEGIINGYGNGKFGPDDELTAAQWGLMLLGALGYEAKHENIGGTGWEIQATKLAISAGVASAEELTGAFNRDAAAKMALNTLTAKTVGYSSGVDITTGDTNISVNAERGYIVSDKNDKKDETIKGDGFMQFAEAHFPKLKITSVSEDNFGRPATEWSYKGTVIGTYADTSDRVVVYTAGTQNSTVRADLKKYDFGDLVKANVYVDGLQEGTSSKVNSVISSYSDIAALTGNGRVVEVYATDNNIDRVVVINATLAKVASVNTKNETVTYTAVKDGDSFSITSETGYGAVEKGDYVMLNRLATSIDAAKGTANSYSTKGDDVFAVADATIVTGAISSSVGGKSITVEGTKYNQAVSYKDEVQTTSSAQDVYLDAYGYVVWTTANTDAGNYLVVTKDAWETRDALGNKVYKVQAVFTDGTVGTYEVADDDSACKAGLYRYEITNGKYDLVKAEATNNDASYGHAEQANIATGDVKLNSHFFAENVTFISIANAGKSNMSATLYTGKQVVTGNPQMYYLTTKSVNDKESGTISTVFVVGGSVATSNDDLIFVADNESNGTTRIDGVVYDTYSVYINGEKTTVPVVSGTSVEAGKFYTYAENSNGVYTLANTTSGVLTGETATAYNNYVTIDDTVFTAADDVVVIDTRENIDDMDKIESVSAIADAKGTITVSAVVDNTKKTVSYIFVTGFAATEKTYTVKVAANDNVKLEGLANESTVTSAAVEKSGLKAGDTFEVTVTRENGTEFANGATFTLKLKSGDEAKVTSKGTATMTFEFEVGTKDIDTSVVSLTKN